MQKKGDGLFTLVLFCPTQFCYVPQMVAQYFKTVLAR